MSSHFDIHRRYLPAIVVDNQPQELIPMTCCQLLNAAIKQQVIDKEEYTNTI